MTSLHCRHNLLYTYHKDGNGNYYKRIYNHDYKHTLLSLSSWESLRTERVNYNGS